MALSTTFSWQREMNNMFIKYMSSQEVFEIFRDCKTHEEWAKRAKGSVEIFYSVPMERGNHSVLKSLPEAAKQDIDLRKAISAAKKKTSKNKEDENQTITSQQKLQDKLLGPKPRGKIPRPDTVLGPHSGFMKKDGSIWEFPPLSPSARAKWPHKKKITARDSKYGAAGEFIPVGRWVQTDPSAVSLNVPLASTETLVFYKMAKSVATPPPIPTRRSIPVATPPPIPTRRSTPAPQPPKPVQEKEEEEEQDFDLDFDDEVWQAEEIVPTKKRFHFPSPWACRHYYNHTLPAIQIKDAIDRFVHDKVKGDESKIPLYTEKARAKMRDIIMQARQGEFTTKSKSFQSKIGEPMTSIRDNVAVCYFRAYIITK